MISPDSTVIHMKIRPWQFDFPSGKLDKTLKRGIYVWVAEGVGFVIYCNSFYVAYL